MCAADKSLSKRREEFECSSSSSGEPSDCLLAAADSHHFVQLTTFLPPHCSTLHTYVYVCTAHIQIQILPPFYATRHFFTRRALFHTLYHTLQSRVSSLESRVSVKISSDRQGEDHLHTVLIVSVQEKLHCAGEVGLCRRSFTVQLLLH